MIEQGTVVEVREGKAVVEMTPSAGCARCGICACGADGKMRIETDAPPGIAVGDPVEVDLPVGRMRAAVTVYLIPLVALLAGAMLGNWVGAAYWPKSSFEGVPAIVGAVVFVVAAFAGVALHERRAAGTRMPPTIRKIG